MISKENSPENYQCEFESNVIFILFIDPHFSDSYGYLYPGSESLFEKSTTNLKGISLDISLIICRL